jgi:hypothetical protein
MPQPGFELTILASKRPQIYALDHVAIGMGGYSHWKYYMKGEVCMSNTYVSWNITRLFFDSNIYVYLITA